MNGIEAIMRRCHDYYVSSPLSSQRRSSGQRLAAYSASWVRSLRPSLRSIFETLFLAVPSLMYRSPAISALVAPRPASLVTSISLAERIPDLSFMLDRALPERPYEGDRPPDDYEGPS